MRLGVRCLFRRVGPAAPWGTAGGRAGAGGGPRRWMAKRAAGDAPGGSPARKLLKLGMNGTKVNHNHDLCEKLAEMGAIERARGQVNKWKQYRTAVDSLRGLDRRVTSGADAKSLPGVGVKIAAKIDEILATGHLHQLDRHNDDPKMKAQSLFTKISGVGAKTAMDYVEKGYRTLEDLQTAGEVAKMTHHQKIGVKYYDDFQQKIPFDEVAALGCAAQDVIRREVDARLVLTVCGSHRRKKPFSGDIDCLLTQPHTASDSGESYVFLKRAAQRLREAGLLIDTISEGPTKVMAVCRQGQAGPARRIDIRWVPQDCYPTALLYFTGSSIFNTRMRTEALKLGYTLNEYGLYKIPGGAAAVAAGSPPSPPRGGTRTEENRVKVGSEEEIFDVLGIEYCEPQMREM